MSVEIQQPEMHGDEEEMSNEIQQLLIREAGNEDDIIITEVAEEAGGNEDHDIIITEVAEEAGCNEDHDIIITEVGDEAGGNEDDIIITEVGDEAGGNEDHDIIIIEVADEDGDQESDDNDLFVPPTPWKRFLMLIEQLTWILVVAAIETRLRTTTSDSARLRECMQLFVPWLSILSLACLCRKYVVRGLDAGVLYQACWFYYFEEEGEDRRKIWHMMLITEALLLFFTIGHVGISAYTWLKNDNNVYPVLFANTCAFLIIPEVITSYYIRVFRALIC
ncbi:hypothetical protein ABFX02_04G224400 [Erythranthe guttata]